MPDTAGQRRYTQTSLERFQQFGWGKLAKWKNGQIKKEGYLPVKRHAIKNVSEYDPGKWGTPEFPPTSRTVCIVKSIPNAFCLNVKGDIEDLCYKERTILFGDKTFISHDYLCSELERRAWEKWGGPEGLKMARQRKAVQATRAQARKQGLNPDDPAHQLPVTPTRYAERPIYDCERAVYLTGEYPMVLRNVDQFDPDYLEDEDEGECTDGTPSHYRGRSRSYIPQTPTRASSYTCPTGPAPPATPLRAVNSATTSVGKGKAKEEEEEEEKPDTSTTVKPSLPTNTVSQSRTSSMPRVKPEDQKPLLPSTPTPRSRPVRAEATPAQKGAKRERDSESEDFDNNSEYDLIPRGWKGSHSAKKRKTRKL